MEFRFEANQEYQLRCIESIAALFDGQPRITASLKFIPGTPLVSAVANSLDLPETAILSNLKKVQEQNRITADAELKCIVRTIEAADGPIEASFPNFSCEMETGTGKTYVYLRSVLELNRRYGLTKFIIVVPSVAVRESVLKSLRISQSHLRQLYDNVVYRYNVYDSGNLSITRQFALSDAIEILILTIDSFNRASNLISQSTDRLHGEKPLHLLQAARPVLILDEPQNMESEKSVAALASLHPLFALRFSATHRLPYNMVYRLTPAEAYRQGLVKRIEVDSVLRENEENQPFIRVDKVIAKKKTVSAKITVHALLKDGRIKETQVTARRDDSLEQKTRRREYAGFTITEMDVFRGVVRFANGLELQEGSEIGANRLDIFRAQIRHTIEEHFRKQSRLRPRGIKVLSLFFIDKVANYASQNAPLRKVFLEEFEAAGRAHPEWKGVNPEAVQAAYFASVPRKGGEVELIDSDEDKESDADAAAFELIMRDKESLLSFPTDADDDGSRKKKQVCFIFSHSALREGWDNPNIFQLCTLRDTASTITRRQEVGRGIRLAVDQEGNRVHDERVNILTVIANESYSRFVELLQSEIASEYRAEIEARFGRPLESLSRAERDAVEREFGEGILPPAPRRAGQRNAKLRKAKVLSDQFKALWERIKHKTRYSVAIDTERLLVDAMPVIDALQIPAPKVTITKSQVQVGDEGVFEALQTSAARTVMDLVGRYPLPNLVDLMADLMEHTTPPVRLTRTTILQVFVRTRDKSAAVQNPHEWATAAVRALKEVLADHIVDGIKYEKVNEWYEMTQILSDEEVALFSQFIVAPDPDRDKTIYDQVPCDSVVEQTFVKDLEARDDVLLYVKLPYWFMVPTPVGEYRPDWAIVVEGRSETGHKPVLYLVSETKGSVRKQDLRLDEWRKIQCGAAHFGSRQFNKPGALDGVDYKIVTKASELP